MVSNIIIIYITSVKYINLNSDDNFSLHIFIYICKIKIKIYVPG